MIPDFVGSWCRARSCYAFGECSDIPAFIDVSSQVSFREAEDFI